MSGKIMGKVWDLDLPHNQLLVLLALADHADHEGNNVYPSLGLIAWKTGYSEQQVRRVLRSLEKIGILQTVERKPGKVTRYRIIIEAGIQKLPRVITPSKMSALPKSHPLHYEGEKVTSTPDMPSPKIDEEPSVIQPSVSAKPVRKENDTVPVALMNPMKDAIALAFSYSWETMTGQEKGLVQRAAKELCQAKLEPDDVQSLYLYCKRNFSSFKPLALAGNVSEWRKTRPSRIIRDDGYIPVEERTSALAGIKLA